MINEQSYKNTKPIKIGTKVWKVIGYELKEFFVSLEYGKTYTIQSIENSRITYSIDKLKGFNNTDEIYLSRIVGLRELEEKTFKALMITRKAIQDFRKEYLQEKGLKEYTEADLQKELYDYDAEQIEGEEL